MSMVCSLLWRGPVLAALTFLVVGCGEKSGSGSGKPTASADKADVEFPEGDPSVSAADGGPGFTGEGWTTKEADYLGDPKAVKGGTISTNVLEWPGNIRMAGTGYNTSLNYLIGDLCYQGMLTLDPNTL